MLLLETVTRAIQPRAFLAGPILMSSDQDGWKLPASIGSSTSHLDPHVNTSLHPAPYLHSLDSLSASEAAWAGYCLLKGCHGAPRSGK